MSIHVICPNGHKLTIADTWAGRAGRCPVCKALVQAPAVAAPIIEDDRAPIPSSHAASLVESVPPARPTQRAPNPVAVTGQASTTAPVGGPPPSTDLRLPPTLPAAGVSIANLLTKAAVDSVVAEIGEAPSVDGSSPAMVQEPPAKIAVPPKIVAPQSVAVAPHNGASQNIIAPERIAVQSRVEIAAATASTSTAVSPEPKHEPNSARPHRGYKPDADKRWTTYYLAAAMAALSLFCAIPALPHWNLGSAPDWARAVLLVSLVQLAYVAWVASVPDWASLWSSMIVFTTVAALYGLTMTVALTTPMEDSLPLDLTDVRRQAVLWCAGVMLLAFLLAYFCGRAASRWRRTFELLNA